MRPKSIVQFERVYLASMALSAIGLAVGWDKYVEEFAGLGVTRGVQQGILIGAVAISLLIEFALLYYIARRANAQAKMVFLIFTALAVWYFLEDLIDTRNWLNRVLIVDAIIFVLNLFAAWLLFRPDAKAWLGSKDTESSTDPHTSA